MKNFKFVVSTVMVAMVLMVGMAGAAMAKEKQKIVVKDNNERDFNEAIKKQSLMLLPAEFEKKLLAVANEQMKFKVDRILFDATDSSNKWKIFNDSKYPYKVSSRSRLAYLLTEQDGKHIRTFWMVVQLVDPVNKNKWLDD